MHSAVHHFCLCFSAFPLFPAPYLDQFCTRDYSVLYKMLQAAVRSSPTPFSVEEYPRADTYQSLQNPAFPAHDGQQADLGSHLVVSPYTTLPHLLDLRPLEESQRLLAKALTALQSVREDYATAPYHQSFNWDAVIERLKSLLDLSGHQWTHQHFYIVVFRSQVPPMTDRTHLGRLDQRSHAEATKSGGLLKYWFGLPDKDGRNLATCTTSAISNGMKPPQIDTFDQAYGAISQTLAPPVLVRGTRRP